EPTPSLVGTFDDPILRPPPAELVVPRGISEARPARHPAVPPHVEDVGDPPHLLAALRTRQDDLVDPRPVEVHAVRVPRRLPQRIRGAHDDPVAALRAPPDRERDAPVPLAGEAPIPQVLGPAHLTGRARPFRIPRDPADLVDHFRLDRCDSQEPLDRRAVEDWRFAAPAVTVRVD